MARASRPLGYVAGSTMLFHLIHSALDTHHWMKRRKALRGLVRETVEREGGEVLRLSVVGIFVRSPFPPLAYQPIYLRADCRYPEDAGTWFVREVRDGPITWAWRSDIESPDLPAPRDAAAFVDNRVMAMPPWIGVAGFVALCAAIPLGMWLLLG